MAKRVISRDSLLNSGQPPIVRHFRHADRPYRLAYRLALSFNTSAWRSFATISSAVCLFLGIAVLHLAQKLYFREDHSFGGRPGSRSKWVVERVHEQQT